MAKVDCFSQDSLENVFLQKQQNQVSHVSMPKINLSKIQSSQQTIQINQNKLKAFKFKNGFKPARVKAFPSSRYERSSKYSSIVSGERNSKGDRVIDDFSEHQTESKNQSGYPEDIDSRDDISKQTFDHRLKKV